MFCNALFRKVESTYQLLLSADMIKYILPIIDDRNFFNRARMLFRDIIILISNHFVSYHIEFPNETFSFMISLCIATTAACQNVFPLKNYIRAVPENVLRGVGGSIFGTPPPPGHTFFRRPPYPGHVFLKMPPYSGHVFVN